MVMLKNYTTNKNYIRTIGEIEQVLAGIGAKMIMKDYDEFGAVKALSFVIPFKGRDIPIRLPARVDRIPGALRHHFNNNKDLSSSQKSLIKKAMTNVDHGRNIGWRIIQDWLEAQIAIMQLDQINMLEALLPFTTWNKNGETLYELLERNDFNLPKLGKTLLVEDKSEGQ